MEQSNSGGGEKQPMGTRGVTRPMALHEMQHSGEHQHGGGEQGAGGGQGQGGGGGGGMTRDHRMMMMHQHHRQTLWIYWTLIALGFWLIAAPFSFGYDVPKNWVEPSGGRGVWFSDELYTALRAELMTWSDILSGLLLVVFGWRTLTAGRPVSQWACCFVGIWITFAPLLFWAPTAAAYLNGTIVGALVIALSILIPGMPGMIMYMQHGPDTPPGWSYNPSSWPQRWIMIVLAFMGWIVSRYLAMFQMGYIETAWDPFFGESTRKVLNSNMSHMWPISDGGLGALSYTFEFLMGWMGSPARWRTMPWMVAFFGILVIPLGLTHIFLVISQPVIVGHWCTMCLLAAAIMLPMIPLEFDEVIAMIQHMVKAKRRGDRGGSLWTVFWKGGSGDESTPDERSPELVKLPAKPVAVFNASIWGMSFPLTLILSTALGVWLMFAPWALGIDKPASAIDHLVGALVVTTSVIAMGEVVRALRFVNVLLGLIVAVVPWFMSGTTTGSLINDVIVGLVIIALAIPRGPKTERYGLWDKYVF